MMMEYLGSTEKDAEFEVKTTKEVHARFLYLRRIIKDYVKLVNQAEKDGSTNTFERYNSYILRTYLMLLVGTTIFSNKAKNYV
ncbi:putative IMP dehydrogenase/GMP reductase, partial [Trifolium medium]|nr:putative IMP dehydrogenase/GMP reductase [Trifolium medium]